MSGEEQKSFLDSRTILAIVLMVVVWFGWESYLKRKYPQPEKPLVTESAQAPAIQSGPVAGQPAATAVAPVKTGTTQPAAETSIPFQSSEINFEVSSAGMGLKNITLNKYFDRENRPIRIGAPRDILPFQVNLRGQAEPIPFKLEKVSDTEFRGTATVSGVAIARTYKVEASKYLIRSTTELSGAAPGAGITQYMSEEARPGADTVSKTLGDPIDTWLSFYVAAEKSVHEHPSPTERSEKDISKASVATLGSRYFTMAVTEDSSVIPNFRMVSEPSRNLFYGAFEYQLLEGNQLRVNDGFFIGPRSVDTLRAADPRLEAAVDFGMFSWIAYPILDLLRWFYKLTHNYGIAIIALTILVRMIVLPFNIMSYKSMKAMQNIQPQITRLKERHKDDREALNREMMILMKENKVNPLGGCLPMLLQLPVFLALYQVLNQTIELYRAPWMLWITDLSLKDPYYVLPVLMGIVMYIQQKMTPTTMDPAQAKVMQFMPIMFTFMMISLPSGLTLYIFVSTLFGILQQLAFMRDKKPKAASKVLSDALDV
ncbi:MAG: membrane protein insertase YidC, partial [Bdellovibrionia bacterium]